MLAFKNTTAKAISVNFLSIALSLFLLVSVSAISTLNISGDVNSAYAATDASGALKLDKRGTSTLLAKWTGNSNFTSYNIDLLNADGEVIQNLSGSGAKSDFYFQNVWVGWYRAVITGSGSNFKAFYESDWFSMDLTKVKNDSPFVDSGVPSVPDRKAHITWMYQHGVTTGSPSGSKTYKPGDPTNRGAMAQFMRRLVGSPGTTKTAPKFTDLNTKIPGRDDDIRWLAAEGITTGGRYPGKYEPNNIVNRGQMAEFLYKLAGSPDAIDPDPTSANHHVPASMVADQEKRFKSDKDLKNLKSTNPKRYYDILWLAKVGITTGYEDNTFRPLMFVNRGQMADFLVRLYDYRHNGHVNNPSTDNSVMSSSPNTDFLPIATQNNTRVEYMFTAPFKHSNGSIYNPDIINQFARLIKDMPNGSAGKMKSGLFSMGCVAEPLQYQIDYAKKYGTNNSLTACGASDYNDGFSYSTPYAAIKNAVQSKGNSVSIVHDGAEKNNNATYASANLNSMQSAYSNLSFTYCARGRACLATTSGVSMHMKYATFTNTKDSSGKTWANAVWISSSNFGDRSASPFENNSVVIYGDTTLFNAINNLFDTMKAGVTEYNPLQDGITGDSGITVFGSPRQNEDQTGLVTNIIVQDQIAPFVREPDDDPQTDCQVTTTNNLFSSTNFASNSLVALKNSGCDVSVVNLQDSSEELYGIISGEKAGSTSGDSSSGGATSGSPTSADPTSGGATSSEQATNAGLLGSGGSNKLFAEANSSLQGTFTTAVQNLLSQAKIPFIKKNVHSKVVAIKGKETVDGDTEYLTFTGSQNFSDISGAPVDLSNSAQGDEIVVKTDIKAVYDLYMKHINYIKTSPYS